MNSGVQKRFPTGKRASRPRAHSARDIINAIFHVQATGCQWHALPKDYPPCKQVCNTFARWRQRGVWDVLLALLRQQVRAKAGRRARPSTAIIDSQSVKTVSKGGSADMTRRQKSQRAQAPHSLRHNGAAAGRGGALGWHSRPGRSQGSADQAVLAL